MGVGPRTEGESRGVVDFEEPPTVFFSTAEAPLDFFDPTTTVLAAFGVRDLEPDLLAVTMGDDDANVAEPFLSFATTTDPTLSLPPAPACKIFGER
jgi:hypothetical protein